MQKFKILYTAISKSKPQTQLNPTFVLNQTRPYSQSTSIPKKQQRIRDHGYDNYMEVEKKIRKVIKFQDLILSHPNAIISSSRLDNLSRRLGFKQFEAGKFLLKFPHVFEIFEHPVQRILYCRLTRKAINQMEQENEALRDPDLSVCAIERLREKEYREKGVDAENIRFSFIVNFPPGFKISKYYKIAVWKWQRLPYWSPYEDVSGYDLRSLEAQNRMEKRAVATIHELLSLTVEKKITLERIAHFRMAMDLPKKLKDFLLQHQGIFYISTRGNHGKLHTVFLREAYKRGDLIEPNGLYLARRKLADLILMSPRRASVDSELLSYRTDRNDRGHRNFQEDSVENNYGRFDDQNIFEQCGEVEGDFDLDIKCDSDYTDEDDGSDEVADT